MSIVIAPPFTDSELATQKVQTADDLWNTRDPERVAAAYTEDTQWRNRTDFLTGRPAVIEFLKRKIGLRAGLQTTGGVSASDTVMVRGAFG